jgi:AcrR family transcriptional regulator
MLKTEALKMIDKKLEILKAGKELFSEKGFKDTNVAEITKKAGMATGTFYNYFNSKDQLFMEIYLEENKKLKKQILKKVDIEAHPMKVIGEVMYLNTVGMQENPILKEWYNKEIFARIEQVYREENGLDQVDFVYGFFIDLIKKWQGDGRMRKDIEPEMIMAIFGAVINVDTHKEEIGIQYFPKLMDHLVEFIMNELLINSDAGRQ